ncbi:MAG TPA: hypothetical protein VIM39_04540 [Candidatus Limnocylindrales bacterium]|jgi:hypothetical protein
MKPAPPIRRFRAAAIAAIATAAIAAGCGTVQPSIDRLLVATGGPLQVTDASGTLVRFDGPPDPVIAVTASDGHVVAATAGGALVTSNGSSGPPRTWRGLDVPAAAGGAPPLIALSPLGRELALAVGDPQGARFDLIVVDVGMGTSRSIAVERGLNGPPSWIGPSTVAMDVIGADGESKIAMIDVERTTIDERAVASRVLSATLDGKRIAVDDPSGDVLIGDVATWRNGTLDAMTRLHGPPGSGVESLAISSNGDRLAVVRRPDAGAATIELFRALEQDWTSVRTLTLAGDGPLSIAWLQ